MKNIILVIAVSIVLSGCRMGPSTYEIFERNMNSAIGTSWVVSANPHLREIYSEDKYIYIFKRIPEGCFHGYLSNRDDKPEKVIGWIIISGKEFCKEQRSYRLVQ